MDTHTIESNGQTFVFEVIYNSSQPCPQCGVPACGKEDILWYEINERKIAIIFDGGYFDLALGDVLEQNSDYNSLPIFIRDWNEGHGWNDFLNEVAYELPIDDFLKSMELLQALEDQKWLPCEEINQLYELAHKAKKLGGILKVMRG